MKEKTRAFFILMMFLSFIIFIQKNEVQANEVVVDLNGYGGLVPKNDTNLMMSEASVFFEISTITTVTEYRIRFNANYTIFNPNETLNVLVGAPFAYLTNVFEEDITILANGTAIEYELIHVESYETSPWKEYLDDYIDRDFFVSNLTFISNTYTILHYSFEYNISQSDFTSSSKGYGGVEIRYDVGTARAWSGNITETVEFRVYGQQPNYYSCRGYNSTGSFKKEPTLYEIENGIRYIWSWDNERIEEDSIGLYFPYDFTWRTSFMNLAVLLITLVIFSPSSRNKRKNELD